MNERELLLARIENLSESAQSPEEANVAAALKRYMESIDKPESVQDAEDENVKKALKQYLDSEMKRLFGSASKGSNDDA